MSFRIKTKDERYQWMLRCIAQTFAQLSEKQVRHAANKIANEIRKFRGDCYGVEISREYIEYEQPYGITGAVRVGEYFVFWAIISD